MAYAVRNSLTLSVVAGLIALYAIPLQAQTNTDPQSEAEDTRLDAVVVTAQKREEALQDVPITMTVLSEQLLQDTGVRDIKDLQVLVTGLTVTSTGNEGQTTARIRGVGTVGDNPGLESSVGVVIDGVYRPRNGVGFGDLGEIERIEVLKGPQGTVFGKNTSAGLINVVTRKPAFDQALDGEITVGNYGAVGVAGSYNDVLTDNAAFRIYAAKRERDGLMDVETAGGPRQSDTDTDLNFHSVRAQLLLEPTENVDINFITDFTSREEDCCVGVTTDRGPTAAIVNALAPGGLGVIGEADPSRRLAFGNRETTQDIKDKGVSAEVSWDSPWFGGTTLTSITATREWDSLGATDLDYTGADIWFRAFDENSVAFETFSQELRLAGSSDRVDWLVGLYYGDEDLERRDAIAMGAAYEPYLSIALLNNIAASFPPGLVNTEGAATFLSEAAGRAYGTTFTGLGSRDHFEQNARSTAVFGNVTVQATDALDLTLGLRYTDEKKTLDSVYANPAGSAGCAVGLTDPAQVAAALIGRGVPAQFAGSVAPTVIGFMCLPWTNVLHNGRVTSQERDEKEWSGSLKAAYRFNDALMGFASVARGYKAGGFNLDRVQSATGFSDGVAGIFPVDDTSFPGEFVDAYELGVKNTWADGNLLFNAALFRQEYSDFQLNSFLGTSYVVRAIPELVSQGLDLDLQWQTGIRGLLLQAGATYTDAEYGDDVLPDADLALLPGSRASFAPRWQGSASATYEWPLGDLIGRFTVGAKHTTEYNTGSDLDPQKLQDAYTLVNARFGIGSANRSWTLELWGQNLTDETYSQVGFDAPLQSGSWNAFLGAPRLYGLTLRLAY